MTWKGFTELNDNALAKLHRWISDGTLELPLYEAALRNKSMGAAWKALEPFANLSEPQLLLRLIEAMQQERVRERATVELVWTGPNIVHSTTRETSTVIEDMLRSARFEVFIAGYTFDHGEQMWEPLRAAMNAHSFTATIVMNIDPDPTMVSAARVASMVKRFLDTNWPSPPYPNIYHDRRTSDVRALASMHAKAIVVDRRICLVGSANFTRRGQNRNIEMGVRVDSQPLAEQIMTHWGALMQANVISLATTDV